MYIYEYTHYVYMEHICISLCKWTQIYSLILCHLFIMLLLSIYQKLNTELNVRNTKMMMRMVLFLKE